MLTHLRCTFCGAGADPTILQNLCTCGRPLGAEYHLTPTTMPRESLRERPNNLWRYREVLPDIAPLTLGEGWTPLLHAHRLGTNWFIKDEGVNPTASFKARGMAVAVAMAKHLGATNLAVPSAGNAGGALAAYCAAAQIEAHVFLPADTPRAFVNECHELGAHVELIEGLITDCAAELQRRKESKGFFEMSTFREPYRLEGKKTMAYELVEQLGGAVPDVIVYPTGGGTGLVGMARAFDEMQKLGWIGSERPKFVCVQAAGCCPIVTAFDNGEETAIEHENAHTIASGLRVPRSLADFAMLRTLRETDGTAVTVTDEEMIAASREIAEKTGIFPAPEGGATLAAAKRLERSGWIRAGETVVLFNTGSGLKYLEAFGG